MNKITILGSGTSTGVPILGCKCQVCQSNDPRNKRFRTSAVIETLSQKRILIDASPDLRTQLIHSGIDRIDAAIITHDHADHTHGIDDLRPFTFGSKADLPVFTDSQTALSLTGKFPYIFQREKVFADKPILGGGIPRLSLQVLPPEASILGEDFTFFPLPHGHTETLGVVHQKMAYVVDCQSIPGPALQKLKNAQLDLLIIDCLRETPHTTHLHLDLSLKYAEFIRPKLTVLTHMGHEWDYMKLIHEIRRRTTQNIIPALDRQSFLYS